MESVENTVLRNLILNEEYNRKVLPFIKPEYFENQHEKVIFEETAKFIVEYDRCPTQEIISVSYTHLRAHETREDRVWRVVG